MADKKIAFVFPGQGSQKVGMAQSLYEANPGVRERFACASSLLGFDLARLCFEGPLGELTRTTNAQPALLCVGICCYDVLVEHGLGCDLAAGHSLGEYTALVAAGALSFTDALPLVKRRAELMDSAPAGSMSAIIGLGREEVESVCDRASERGVVIPANYNCPGQIVISGEMDAVEQAELLAKERGAKKVIRLPVSGAFHSPLMTAAGEAFKETLNSIPLRQPRFPIVTNVTAEVVDDPEEIRSCLCRQMTSPVLWEESVRRMVKEGVEIFVELGPGKVLAGLIRRTSPESVVYNVEDRYSLEETLSALL